MRDPHVRASHSREDGAQGIAVSPYQTIERSAGSVAWQVARVLARTNAPNSAGGAILLAGGKRD